MYVVTEKYRGSTHDVEYWVGLRSDVEALTRFGCGVKELGEFETFVLAMDYVTKRIAEFDRWPAKIHTYFSESDKPYGYGRRLEW